MQGLRAEPWLWNFAIMASAGFPGISRGSRKLRVIATHSVRMKKPRRRSAYLKLVRLLVQAGGFRVRGQGSGRRALARGV